MSFSHRKEIIIIMGVSGSGKTVIGQLLASELSIPFIDADDFHSAKNIEKMIKGQPLKDEDRWPWLDNISKSVNMQENCIVACSALKRKYRSFLSQAINKDIQWIYLKGDYDTIFNRMKTRQNHFMIADMLQSQFDILEEPSQAIALDVSDTPESIVKQIKIKLK